MRSCPAVSGRTCSARRAREHAVAVGQLPNEVRVVGHDAPQASLRRQLVRVHLTGRHAGDLLLLRLLALGLAVQLLLLEVLRGGWLRLLELRLFGGPRVLLVLELGPVQGRGLDVRRAHDQLTVLRLGWQQLLKRRSVGLSAPSHLRPLGRALLAALTALVGPRAQHARAVHDPAAGRPQQRGEREARQQSHADEEQEDHEDVHPDLLHEPVGDVVERLPERSPAGLQEARRPLRGAGAACARAWTRADPERSGRQGQHDRAGQAEAAGTQRPQRGQHRAHQQHPATAGQREWRQRLRAPDAPAQGERQPMADAAAVPVSIEDEAHEHAQRDQAQGEHVALALVELGQPRRPAGRGPARGGALAPGSFRAPAAPAASTAPGACSSRAARAALAGASGGTGLSHSPRNFDVEPPDPATSAYHRFSVNRYTETWRMAQSAHPAL